ncbi:MAG: PorT family protein [Prevotella sp.]|nr:PorT family protein [Prevotella sp.]
MKKLLALLVVCCATAASAQNEKGKFSIKPMAGVNISTFARGTENMYKSKTGITVGAEAEYGLTDRFGLSLGLMYSKQGAKIDGDQTLTTYDEEGNYYVVYTDMDGKLKADYLNVPLLANFYIPAVKGLSLKAGVQMGILVNDEMNVAVRAAIDKILKNADDAPYFSVTDAWVSRSDVCKSLDFGIPVGLSYEYKGFTLDARYYFGLTKLDKTENPDNARNRYLSITLGYRFGL